jgi:pimeloyl-ACP methyl ester carboxylesterase
MMKKLLLLHGALASKTQFDPLLPFLKTSLEAEAINFSGHGGALPNINGYTFPVFANDILTYLDSNKIERINLFGFSMGGYAALYFAKLYPERVEKIFTLNVKFKWDATSTQKEVALLNAENMLLKVPSFANNLMLLHGMEMWKKVLDHTSDMMTNLTKQHFLTDEDFEKLSVPILLGIGDRDITSSIEETFEIYRKIKFGQLLVIPNTFHPFEKIAPEIISTEMKRFFLS